MTRTQPAGQGGTRTDDERECMSFPAKFPGTCSRCGQAVAVGESVDWDRAAHKVWHSRCDPAAPAEVSPAAPDAALPSPLLPAPAGLSYSPFQASGIGYALTRFRAAAQKGGADPSRGKGVLIADEMG